MICISPVRCGKDRTQMRSFRQFESCLNSSHLGLAPFQANSSSCSQWCHQTHDGDWKTGYPSFPRLNYCSWYTAKTGALLSLGQQSSAFCLIRFRLRPWIWGTLFWCEFECGCPFPMPWHMHLVHFTIEGGFELKTYSLKSQHCIMLYDVIDANPSSWLNSKYNTLVFVYQEQDCHNDEMV